MKAESRGSRAWGALLQVHATLVPMLDHELRSAAGIPLAWYDVLLELNGAEDRQLTMSELGRRVVLSRTRVSRLVDEMTADGLVERRAHPSDRRSSFAAITTAGRRALRAAAPVYLRSIEVEFAAQLSDRELDVIGDALWRVHAAHRTGEFDQPG